MKTSLVLFHQDALEKFPYLHYIYNAIIETFTAKGECKSLGFQEVSYQKIVAEAGNLSLLQIGLPSGNSIKKGLWEKINYPALVKQLLPENIFYIGEQLPVLKDARGAKQWAFVADLTAIDVAAGAKPTLIKKQHKLLGALLLVDKIVSYSKTAVGVIAGKLPTAGAKLVSWEPVPDERYLDTALYTEELLDTFKQQNTGDESYFLLDARGAKEETVIEYFKAFSYFKKWQRSSMQLALLIAPSLHKNADFLEKFDTYYYKADVHLLSGVDRPLLYGWIRSAYAVVIPNSTDQGLDLQLAAACLGTLIVAPETPTAELLLPGARFELAALDKDSLGKVLVSCYKSEILRARHIRAGKESCEIWGEVGQVIPISIE